VNWINLEVSIIRAPAYVGSNPIERATWFNVLAYAVEQENAGRIAGAADWKDRQWQQACGVTAREVRNASKLLCVDGADVVVAFYPAEKEREVRARRLIAKDASARRWGNPSMDASMDASMDGVRDASIDASGNAEGERKEKEKGKEGEIGASAPARRVFSPPSPEEVTAYAAEIGYPLDGQAWCDSYAQKGWLVGKAKMKDWRAAVRNWKRNGWRPGASMNGRPNHLARPELGGAMFR